jgi:hypothetical protein
MVPLKRGSIMNNRERSKVRVEDYLLRAERAEGNGVSRMAEYWLQKAVDEERRRPARPWIGSWHGWR